MTLQRELIGMIFQNKPFSKSLIKFVNIFFSFYLIIYFTRILDLFHKTIHKNNNNNLFIIKEMRIHVKDIYNMKLEDRKQQDADLERKSRIKIQ